MSEKMVVREIYPEGIYPEVNDLFELENKAMQVASEAESYRVKAALARRDLTEDQRKQYEFLRELYRSGNQVADQAVKR